MTSEATVFCKECGHNHINSFEGEGPQPRCMDVDYDDYGRPDKACECSEYIPEVIHVDEGWAPLELGHEAEAPAS